MLKRFFIGRRWTVDGRRQYNNNSMPYCSPSTVRRPPSCIYKLHSYNNGSCTFLTKPKRSFLEPISLKEGLWDWQSLANLFLKIGWGTAFLFGFFFSVTAQSTCPACEVLVPDSLQVDTFFVQEFPDGAFQAPYLGNVSFRLPVNTNEVLFLVPDLPGNIPFSNFKIKSIDNLPTGLVWLPSQAEYNLPDERNGCIMICGRPLQYGLFEVAITVTASIIILDQDATFTRTLYIAPPSSNNSGFGMNNNIGCGETAVAFENNNPSNGEAGYHYSWDFGNGITSNKEQPTMQLYDTEGVYPVQYQAIIDTVPPTLTEIAILTSSCTDLLGKPDLYFRLYDDLDTLVLETESINNTNPPVRFDISTALTASEYRLEIWDGDSGLGFQDDSCGVFTFAPTLSDTLKTEDLKMYLTILRSADTIQVQDSVIVHPLPAQPTIALEEVFFCEGDTMFLTASYLDNVAWYKDGLPINAAMNPVLAVTSTGEYHVSYTSPVGCIVFSDPVFLETIPLPATPTFSNSNNVLQLDNEESLPINYELQWFQEGNLLETTGTKLCVTETGNYGLQLKNTDSECTTFFEKLITIDEQIDCTTAIPELAHFLETVSIYPNPTTDWFILEFSTLLPIKDIQLRILNTLGQSVVEKQYPTLLGPQQLSFDLSQQVNGIYWVILQSEKGVSSWKVVKR